MSLFTDMDEPPQTYDPDELSRVYYRHAITGDLGWLVVRDGKDKIKLDRPNEDLCKPFVPSEWIPELEHRPLTRFQAAQVAYLADQRLLMLMGNFQVRKEWNMQHEDYRIKWSEEGPPANPPVRQEMFRSIMRALERVTK